MWKLIRKDLILGRRILWINGGIALLAPLLLFALDEPMPLGFYVAYVALMCAMLPVSLVAREDKFSAAALSASLPVTRNAIVTSRFVGGAAISAGALVIVFSFGLLFPAIRQAWTGGVGGAVLGAVVTIGLVLAIFLPFTIRFGITGLLFGLVGLQVLGMVLFLLALATGSMTGLERAIRSFIDFFGDLRTSLGRAGFSALLIGSVVAANLVSWGLSKRLFRRRDL